MTTERRTITVTLTHDQYVVLLAGLDLVQVTADDWNDTASHAAADAVVDLLNAAWRAAA